MSAGGTSALINRARELKRLVDAAVAAERSDGRVAIMFGEPGSGKSVLVRELARWIDPGRLRVCVARAYRGDAGIPYGLWRALIADYPDLGALIPAPLGEAQPPADGIEALARRCAGRLIEYAAEQPIVLIFERLDAADESSLTLIETLAERLDGAPLSLLLTMSAAAAHSPAAARGLARLSAYASPVIVELEPIAEGEIDSFLAAQFPDLNADRRSWLASAFHRLSGGNGLLLSELMRALADGDIDAGAEIGELEQLPTSLLGAAEQRVSRLAGDTVETLEVAALAGEMIQPELLYAVLPRPAAEIANDLEEAIASGLLSDTADGGLRFRHGIFRQALVRKQSSLRRRRRHQEIAAWLNTQRDARPEDIGYHAEQAGDLPIAYAAYLRAAEAAERIFALPEAARDYRRALALVASLGLEDAAVDDLRLRLADALFLIDRDASEHQITRVITRAGLRGDRLVLARALQRRSVRLYEDGFANEALATLEEILPILQRGDDHRSLAFALTYAGYCHGSANDLPALERVAGELLELAERASQPDYRAMALQFQAGILAAQGRPETAPALARESVEIMAELGRFDRATDYAAVAIMRVDIPCGLGQPERVDSLLRRGEELQTLRSARLGIALPHEPAFLAVHFLRGDWDVVRNALGALDEPREPMPRVVSDILHNLAADLARAEGRDDDAEALSAQIAVAPEAGLGEHSFPHWLAAVDRRITLALERGELDVARAWHEALQREIEQRRHAPGELLTSLVAARLSLAHGRSERAEQLARKIVERAEATGNVLIGLQGQRLIAAALRRRGETAASIDASHSAAREARGLRLPYEALLARLDAADGASERADTHDEANALIEQCLADATALGATAMRRRAEQLRQRLSAYRRVWPAGLTDREVEVLRLLATGLADRAIADRLYISPRTVTTHVGNLLGKTTSANRTELALWAVQRGLTTPETGLA